MNATQALALMIARDVYLEDGNIERFRAALSAGGIEDGPSGEPGISMHDHLEWQMLFENRDLDRDRRALVKKEEVAQKEYEAKNLVMSNDMVAKLRAMIK